MTGGCWTKPRWSAAAFSLSLLARLIEQPEPALAERADRLSARGFLQPRPPDSYEFGHELMRRAAYEALSEPRRRLLHRQAAEALADVHAAAGSVATHYAASDRPWLALEPALAAAEQAARVVAYDEALAWCEQAQAIAEAHPAARASRLPHPPASPAADTLVLSGQPGAQPGRRTGRAGRGLRRRECRC